MNRPILVLLFLAACGGGSQAAPKPDPSLDGAWTADAVLSSGSCTGTLSLSGPNAALTGNLDCKAKDGSEAIAGPVRLSAIGWDGSAGQLSGQATTASGQPVPAHGAYDGSALDLDLGFATVTAHR